MQAGQLGGAPTAFAGDDLVPAVGDGAHDDGLHDTLGLDAVGQILQRLRLDVPSRLVFAPLDEVHRQFLQDAVNRLFLPVTSRWRRRPGAGSQQGIQPATQPPFLARHQNSPLWYAAGSVASCCWASFSSRRIISPARAM